MHQVIAWERPHVAISQDEREFFIALGARIATLRKGSQITQVQLAQTLGISQSTVNAYEVGPAKFRATVFEQLSDAKPVADQCAMAG
jgi:DNA-binding XRE family transcriptional regulator